MDTIKVPSHDVFADQVKIHQDICDGLKQVVSQFDTQHTTILEKLDKDHALHYQEWWKNFRATLLDHADVHDKLGKHLTTAKDNYYDADQQIAQKMHPKDRNVHLS